MLKAIGADLKGMSTVPEVIAMNHLSIPCAAVSVVTDECATDNLKPINIAEVIERSWKSDVVLSKIFGSEFKKIIYSKIFSGKK